MEIRSGNEIVEVSAGAQAELQTTDAVVGGVVSGQTLTHLPTLQRDSRELLTLQPGSTPYETSNGGGLVMRAARLRVRAVTRTRLIWMASTSPTTSSRAAATRCPSFRSAWIASRRFASASPTTTPVSGGRRAAKSM